jgi:hypothetical protein
VVVAVAMTAAACGGSSSSPTTTSSGTGTHKNLSACLRAHGISVPNGALVSKIKSEFKTVPVATQEAAYADCLTQMSKKAKKKLEELIAKEGGTVSTTATTAAT